MKLTPYKELLKMGKEAIAITLAPMRAHSAKKKAELEVAKLEERVATLHSELNQLCSESDLDFDKIIKKLDDIALVERRKKQFDKIIEEMFPEAHRAPAPLPGM
jgi:hypothetical protein